MSEPHAAASATLAMIYGAILLPLAALAIAGGFVSILKWLFVGTAAAKRTVPAPDSRHEIRERINDHQRCIDALQKLYDRHKDQ